jgi:predicted RNA binding protein YcfA (HicA-like mRNA interferase family)
MQDSQYLIDLAIKNNYKLSRINGSHHIFTKENCNSISIPHPRKDLGRGLKHKIIKQILTGKKS